MKKLAFIISLVPMLAFAQLGTVTPSSKVHAPATTNTGAILVAGSFTTNLPANAQYLLPVPKTPWGWYVRCGGTNAETTTNAVITFEALMKDSAGLTQIVDNVTLNIYVPGNGTSGYDYVTNYLPLTDRLWSSYDFVRVKSIQNTNGASLWITNLFQIRDPL